MSEKHPEGFDPRLLDLHLGHLSPDERAVLEQEFETNPELKHQNDTLESVFGALNTLHTIPAPSADLAARAAERVREAGPAPRVVRPADELTETLERRSQPVIRLGNLRDIVAVAAVLVLAVGLGIPSLLHMRERAERLGCSRNLQALGMGIQQYAQTFNASLPFTGWSHANSSWAPSDNPGVERVPNRRHVYPLLRLAYVQDPRLFVCPGRNDVPMPSQQIANHRDFLEARNISYAYQNMAGVRPSIHDLPDMPILADDNPLFADGIPLLDARRLRWGDPAEANSDAHGRAGQNILTLDGRVMWVTTPQSGIDGDNIWTLRQVTEYTGQEGPGEASDSHLIK